MAQSSIAVRIPRNAISFLMPETGQVIVDGNAIGYIKKGGQERFAIGPGLHTIKVIYPGAGVFWNWLLGKLARNPFRSNYVDVTTSKSSTINLESGLRAGPVLGCLGVVPFAFWVIKFVSDPFRPTGYLGYPAFLSYVYIYLLLIAFWALTPGGLYYLKTDQ